MNNSTAVFPVIPASLTAQALVSHTGLGMLAGFLNALGFRKLCENRFSQFVSAMAGHRLGKILGSLAMMLSAGGGQVTDLDQLRAAPALLGSVASDATISPAGFDQLMPKKIATAAGCYTTPTFARPAGNQFG